MSSDVILHKKSTIFNSEKMECFVPMQPRSLLLQVLEEEQEGWTKLRSLTDDRCVDAKLKLGTHFTIGNAKLELGILKILLTFWQAL